MIRHEVYIRKYDWRVEMYYAVTCYHVDDIMRSLVAIDCPKPFLRKAYDNLSSCKLDNGITYTNSKLRSSVVVIGMHSSPDQFLDSFLHELRHLTDHLMASLHMEPGGEDIAYLTGDLGKELVKDVAMFICDCHCHKHAIEDTICEQNNKKSHGNKNQFKTGSCPSCGRYHH